MFQSGETITKAYVGGTEVVKAYKGGGPSIWPVEQSTEIIFHERTGPNPSLTVEFDHHGTNATTTKPHFYYRVGVYINSGYKYFDSEDWIEVTGNSITVIPTFQDEKHYHILQLCGKGNTTIGRSQNDYTTINIIQEYTTVMVCNIDLDKLLDYDNPPTVLPDYCFYKLFYWDALRFRPSGGYMIYTLANTSGNYSFAYCFRNMYSDYIVIDLGEMANRQETTFNNWITDTRTDNGYIDCPSSLYLETNSDSGVPNGWTRIDT